MKLKPIYLYLIAFVVVIAAIIFFSKEDSVKQTARPEITGEMPQDDIHQNLPVPGSGSPSKDNVRDNIKHQLEALKKSVDENPDDTVKIKRYAEMLAASHKSNEAIQQYVKILKKDPNRTDVLAALAFIHYGTRNFIKAEELTERILDIDEDDTQAIYNLGAINASKGEKDKAREIWNNLINKYPESDAAKLAKTSITKL